MWIGTLRDERWRARTSVHIIKDGGKIKNWTFDTGRKNMGG